MLEIMIVVALIGLLTVISIPAFIKARASAQANICRNNQRHINSAKEMFALEHKKVGGTVCVWADLMPYLHHEPVCPGGAAYELEPIGPDCYCPLHDFRAP